MAQEDAVPVQGEGELEPWLNPARKALLKVHGSLAHLYPTREGEHPREEGLLNGLRRLGVLGQNEAFEAPTEELRHLGAALQPDPERSDSHGIPRTELGHTAIDVLSLGVLNSRDEEEEFLGPVVRELLANPEDAGEQVDSVLDLLRMATGLGREMRMERWPTFRAGASRAGLRLHEDIAAVKKAWCDDSLVQKLNLRSGRADGEYVVRIETFFEVERNGTGFDHLCWAAMPYNWPSFNKFFCSLTRRADLDSSCFTPARRAPELTPDLQSWHGVYEERVAKCDEGAFPDTFLLFNWLRRPGHLVLRYELNPQTDRTVLRVDQGYIQIDEVGSSYHVSTIKHLLFDDEDRAPGGQTMGLYACQLGWLDCSITQFTKAAADARARYPARASTVNVFEAKDVLLSVLDGCANRAEASAASAVGQVDDLIRFVRSDQGGLEEHSKVQLKATVERLAQDAGHCLQGHIDLAMASGAIVQGLGDQWKDAHGL
jgi:hypothetical protein